MSCKTINIDLANVPPVPLQIGVAGENAFRTITFDASKWGADYPNATYTVVYRRSDGYLYPVLVNASADAIVWNPTVTDTAVSGNGQLEVRLLDGETIGKTIIMQTYVAPSLSGDESEPSTPAPDWVNDVADDADRAEAAVSHYPKIVNGVWFVWDATQSEFVSTGINAQGEDGVSPTVTVTEIEGGHRVTITDADGAHTFDVMDGEDGEGGGSAANAVLYTAQTLTHAQKAQARENIGAASTSDIPTKTSDLTNDSNYLTPGQIVTKGNTVIDPTLLVEGAAADAAAVGDKIKNIDTQPLKDTLEFIEVSDFSPFTDTVLTVPSADLVRGEYMVSTTGEFKASSLAVYRTDYIALSGESVILIPHPRNNYAVQVAFYNAQKGFISGSLFDNTYPIGTTALVVPQNASYFVYSGYQADIASMVVTGKKAITDVYTAVNAYHANNTAAVAASAFPIKLPQFGYESSTNIVAMLANISNAGALSVGVADNKTGGLSEADVTWKATVSIPRGAAVVELPPFQMGADQVIAIGRPSTDTALFYYGTNGADKGFVTASGRDFPTYAVGISFFGYRGEIAATTRSVRLDRMEDEIDALKASVYSGKSVSILGDSISTFAGYIPSGNANFYTGSNCGVSSVNDTWWMKFIKALGMQLAVNNSWSGSRVTTTGGNESAGCMTRCQNLGDNPDVIVVYMGANDFSLEVALGTYDGNGDFPTSTSTFREAYAIMLNKIMTTYPTSEVWCATMPPCEQNGAVGAPEKNDSGVLLNDFNKAIRELARIFGARILEHAQCGLTYQNLSLYMGDYASGTGRGLHPNAAGHSLIANNDIWQIDPSCKTRY